MRKASVFNHDRFAGTLEERDNGYSFSYSSDYLDQCAIQVGPRIFNTVIAKIRLNSGKQAFRGDFLYPKTGVRN